MTLLFVTENALLGAPIRLLCIKLTAWRAHTTIFRRKTVALARQTVNLCGKGSAVPAYPAICRRKMVGLASTAVRFPVNGPIAIPVVVN